MILGVSYQEQISKVKQMFFIIIASMAFVAQTPLIRGYLPLKPQYNPKSQ